MNGGVPMERTEREGLQALLMRRVAIGWTRSLLAVPGCAPTAASGGAEGGGERFPPAACPAACPSDTPSLEAMYRTLRELEAELYALEDQRRTALSDEIGAGWT